MLVSEVIGALEQSLGEPEHAKYEGVISGDVSIRLTGIATCAQPSMAVLKQCVAKNCNLIIADGHPFYTYSPEWGAKNVRETVDASQVGKAKAAYIAKHQLVIVRFTSAFAQRFPTVAAEALAMASGFDELTVSDNKPFVTTQVSKQSVDSLARVVAVNTKTTGIRLIAKPELTVSKIAIGTGMLSPADIAGMLSDPDVDAVIGGEVVEWEGGPYFEDVIGSGRKAGLMLLGFASSREPMADSLASWVAEVVADASVTTVHDIDPIHAV